MSNPDIVLIHGFWVTPRSWEEWIAHYEGRGFTVHAPAYPGFEVEVEALNADPSPIEAVTVPQIMERLETLVGGLDAPPIIIGHSAGGVFTQLLLDRGHGAAGVAINSAPTEGVKRVPLSQVRATFRPESFNLLFAVRVAGELAGVQSLHTVDSALTRTAETGSWLGRSFQGRGVGTRTRRAVCAFAFDALGAVEVTSGAFLDNPSSLAVSRKVAIGRMAWCG